MNLEHAQLIANIRSLPARFGAWLREQREERNLTQAELARRIGLNHRTQLTNIEKGGSRLDAEFAVRIAEALDLPADEVLRRAGFAIGDDGFPPELIRFRDLSETYKGLVVKQISMYHRAQKEEGGNDNRDLQQNKVAQGARRGE